MTMVTHTARPYLSGDRVDISDIGTRAPDLTCQMFLRTWKVQQKIAKPNLEAISCLKYTRLITATAT